MRRSVLAALVTFLSLACAASPDGALAQADPCAMQASDRWVYVDVAGPWERHGLALEVDPRGCGTLAWGDGVAQPHGVAGFVLDAREGAGISGHFVGDSDAADGRGGGIVLRPNDDGTLTAAWDDTPTTFCRPWLPDPARCGA